MSKRIEVVTSPVLRARERAVASLSDPELKFNAGEATSWLTLPDNEKALTLGAAAQALEDEQILLNADNEFGVMEDLHNTNARPGKPEYYTEGIIGLVINQAFAALAKNGFIREQSSE